MVDDSAIVTKGINQFIGLSVYILTKRAGYLLCASILLYLLFYTKIWWLVLIYLSWIWGFDQDNLEKGGRNVQWVRQLPIWQYVRNYFPINLRKASNYQLVPEKNYLFCCLADDSIFSKISIALCTDKAGFNELFPGHKVFMLTNWKYLLFPLHRELLLSMGYVSNSPVSMDYLLRRNKSSVVTVMIGDCEEVTKRNEKQYRIKLKDREREFKLALRLGASIVPVIPFSKDFLEQYDRDTSSFGRISEWFKGLFGHSLIPKQKEFSVVGKILPNYFL